MEKKKTGKINTILSNITRWFAAAFFLFLLALPLSLVGPRLFNCQPYVVISSSMEPALPLNSVVYVRPQDPSTLVEGEIVCFFMNAESETPTTHRVLRNDREKEELITKGDANAKEDIVPIPYAQVVGKVLFSVPFLGRALEKLATFSGKAVYLSLFLLSLVLFELSDVLKGEKNG